MFEVILASQAPNGAITADRRLYVTADEKTLVEDGDSSARYLLAAPGHQISSADVAHLSLVVEDGKVIQQIAPASSSRLSAAGRFKRRSTNVAHAG
jgi:hypothetical protein